jgi:hypothetical protein
VITNRSAAAHIKRALVVHLGAFFTPYTIVMFIIGLWLGYLGAVDAYRACRQEPRDHGVAVSCPAWTAADD